MRYALSSFIQLLGIQKLEAAKRVPMLLFANRLAELLQFQHAHVAGLQYLGSQRCNVLAGLLAKQSSFILFKQVGVTQLGR